MIADEFEAIRRRQEEIKAERDLAVKGTSAPSEDAKKLEEYTIGWPYTAAADYDPA